MPKDGKQDLFTEERLHESPNLVSGFESRTLGGLCQSPRAKGPSLEGKRLSRDNVKKKLRDYQEYASRTIGGVVDGVSKRPVGVLEPLDDQRQLLKELHNGHRVMSEEKCHRPLKYVVGVI